MSKIVELTDALQRMSGVLEEAEFYNIADLVALVKQQITDRDALERNRVSNT